MVFSTSLATNPSTYESFSVRCDISNYKIMYITNLNCSQRAYLNIYKSDGTLLKSYTTSDFHTPISITNTTVDLSEYDNVAYIDVGTSNTGGNSRVTANLKFKN